LWTKKRNRGDPTKTHAWVGGKGGIRTKGGTAKPPKTAGAQAEGGGPMHMTSGGGKKKKQIVREEGKKTGQREVVHFKGRLV